MGVKNGRKLRVFENMVMRRIFGPRRDELTGDWRRLHNEELNDLYCSPNIVRVIKYKKQAKLVLYFSIFIFLNSKLEYKNCAPNDIKHALNSICS